MKSPISRHSKLISPLIILCFATLFTEANAQVDEAWNRDRAIAFSKVCMGTAPTFADFGRAAGQVGFRQIGKDIIFAPEVVVSLVSDGDNCLCGMTMGAPDLDSLVLAVFAQLNEDFPGGWKPSGMNGAINDTTFVRDSVDVQLLLTPFRFADADWLDARVVVPGACS